MTMATHQIQTQTTVEPQPKEQENIHYALGDVGNTEDMTMVDNNIILAAASFRPKDPCFVLRSEGGYTFARVISCELGQKPCVEVQVNRAGCTKSIPMHLCSKYIRKMKSMVKEESKKFSYQPRRRSSTAPRINKPFSASFKAQRQPTRRSSIRKNFSSTSELLLVDGQIRLSLETKTDSAHESFLSSLEQDGLTNAKKMHPGRFSCRSSIYSGLSNDEFPCEVANSKALEKKNSSNSVTDHNKFNGELNRALLGMVL